MIKTTRYCDICSKEISNKFFQIQIPEMNEYGKIVLSNIEKDVCPKCFEKLYWKIVEIKHPGVHI